MTITPWNFGIPDANHDPSDDQPLMRQNNDNIANTLGINHISFDDTNAGRHKQIDLQDLTTLSALISGFGTIASLNGKFVYRSPDGTITTLPLDINTLGSGYVNIGGFYIQMGTNSLPVNSAKSISFSIPFPIECRVPFIVPIKGGTSFPRVKLLLWDRFHFEANSDMNTNLAWVAFGR